MTDSTPRGKQLPGILRDVHLGDLAAENSLYEHLRRSGVTLVSVAHRASLLRHHDRVLQLQGDGGWALQAAAGFSFER